MTRVTESISTQLPTTDARRCAAVVAKSVARGAGQVGLFLGRQGAAAAKKGVECAKAIPSKSAARSERAEKPRGRKRLAVFVIAGVAVIGGAAFYKSRRREHPPVASAPPRVDEKTA